MRITLQQAGELNFAHANVGQRGDHPFAPVRRRQTRLMHQQAFTDDTLTVCPTCGGKLRKVFSSIGVSFTGSGFYQNDSRSDAKAALQAHPKKHAKSHADTASHGEKGPHSDKGSDKPKKAEKSEKKSSGSTEKSSGASTGSSSSSSSSTTSTTSAASPAKS